MPGLPSNPDPLAIANSIVAFAASVGEAVSFGGLVNIFNQENTDFGWGFSDIGPIGAE